MPAVGLSFRRDYIPVVDNEIVNYKGIIRYNLTPGFKVAKGGDVKME